MRPAFHDIAEKGRHPSGPFATGRGERRGLFTVQAPAGACLNVLVSDGAGWHLDGLAGPAWEHVRVCLPDRCPAWDEMRWAKGPFRGPEECVVQFHPPASACVNRHPCCLHLWKVAAGDFPTPPKECVG